MNAALMLVKDNALIVGFFLAAWAIWKVAGWKNVVDASLQLQSKNIEQLGSDVQTLRSDVQTLRSDVQTLTNNVQALTNNVQALTNDVRTLRNDVQILTNNFSRLDARVTTMSERLDGLQSMFTVLLGRQVAKSASPRTLTAYGVKLSQQIDAPSLAARYAPRLRDKISSMNAWQIQQLCFDHAENAIINDLHEHDIDRYNQVTMCACQEGIDLSKVMRVVGIVMRDQLLQQTGQLPRVQTAPVFPGGDYSTLGLSHT